MSDETGAVEAGTSSDAVSDWANEPEADKAPDKIETAPEKKPETDEAKPAPKADPKPDKEPEKKPDPAPKRKIRVKDEEVDEDEAAKGYLRGRDYTKKTQELAAERKKLEDALSKADDPVQFYRSIGKDEAWIKDRIGKAAYAFFADDVDPQTGQPLTEEQKRLRVAEKRLAEVDAEKQSAAAKAKEQEEAQTRAEAERHWVKTIVGHLEKSGAPKHILPRVAQHLNDAIEADQSLDPADVLEDATSLAWEDIEAEHKALLGTMDFAAIKAKFPELVEKVRSGFVAEFKSKRATPKPVEIEIAPEEKERRQRAAAKPRNSRDALRSWVG